jgi:hypothetical protein
VKTYTLYDELPYTGLDFFLVPFYVPPGTTKEIQMNHRCADPTSTTNILDAGIQAPDGTVVGWGGGNQETAIVGLQATSRSYLFGPADPKDSNYLVGGNWSVLIGKARISVPPGSYSINITLLDTPSLPPQTQRRPYVPAAPLVIPPSLTWFAGDFHVHDFQSGDAYANATLDEIATFARDVAGLDFVHFSDHNTVSAGTFMVDSQSRFDDILLLPGVEHTTYLGHEGAILTTEFVDFRMGWPNSANFPNQTVTIEGAIQAIHNQGGLFSINHRDLYDGDPNGDLRNSCVGCAFNHNLDLALVDAVEVAVQSFDGEGIFYTPIAFEWWDQAHKQGYHQIAPIGGSDDHHGGQNRANYFLYSSVGSPTTMVLAANLSHAGIREGLGLGRTVVKFYNNSDPMVDLVATYIPNNNDNLNDARSLRKHKHAAASKTSVVTTAAGTDTRIGGTLIAPSPTSGRVLLTATIEISAATTDDWPKASWYLAFVRNNEQTYVFNVTAADAVKVETREAWKGRGVTNVYTFTADVMVPDQGVDRWRVEAHDASSSNTPGSTRNGQLHTSTNHIFVASAQTAERFTVGGKQKKLHARA